MQWYLHREGVTEGPLDEFALAQMVASGAVLQHHLVLPCDGTSVGWVYAGTAGLLARAQTEPPIGPLDPRARALTREASNWLLACLVLNVFGFVLWGLGVVAAVLATWKGLGLRARAKHLRLRPAGVVTYLWIFGLLSFAVHGPLLALAVTCATIGSR